ncbi:MAG TPA: M23 family metallopeptidase [Firmicutes bacterium]|nr:M23 family metallopeptidase [Bacillota bacterium]
MRGKKKWQRPRSSLRARLEGRRERSIQPYYGNLGGFTGQSFEDIPQALIRQLRDNMFEKTVAAIIVVLCLGVFSLFNFSLTERITEYAYQLTVRNMDPASWVDAAKPVMQAISDFKWFQGSQAPPPAEADNNVPEIPPGKMIAPVNGVLSSPFGTRMAADGEGLEMHYGIDVITDPNSPVYAAFAGTVNLIKEHEIYGTTIYLLHQDEMVTIYGRVTDVAVSVGDEVAAGQIIAGVAPNEKGESHLHFEIWEEKQPVDPETYLVTSGNVIKQGDPLQEETDIN